MTAARLMRKQLELENRSWPEELTTVSRERWVAQTWDDSRRIRVLRSRRFLVQIFQEDRGVIRLSVNRTELAPGGEQWAEGISWDQLQGLKAQAGYGDAFAVEIYPPERDEVNVANMRHLWILPSPLGIGWKRDS